MNLTVVFDLKCDNRKYFLVRILVQAKKPSVKKKENQKKTHNKKNLEIF